MMGTEARTARLTLALLLCVYAAGAAAVTWAAVAGNGEAPSLRRVVLVVALSILVEYTGFFVALGAAKMRVDWNEAVIVLGVVLLSTSWLVLISTATMALLEIVRHSKVKQGTFNVATTAVSSAAAGGAAGLLGHNLHQPATWAGLASAGLVFALANAFAVHPVVALSTGQRLRDVVRCQLPPLLATTTVGTGLALLTLAAWTWSRPSLLLAPPLIAGAWFMHRHYARSATQTDALRRLEVASRTFDGLEESRILSEILDRACALFCVERAELLLRPENGQLMTVISRDGEQLRRRSLS